MCTYEGHMCVSVPNMKCLCLYPWLGEVCRDYNTNDNDAQWTEDDSNVFWLIKQMSKKNMVGSFEQFYDSRVFT